MESAIKITSSEANELFKQCRDLQTDEQFCYACGLGFRMIIDNRVAPKKANSALRASFVKTMRLDLLKDKMRKMIQDNINFVGELPQEKKNIYCCISAYDVSENKSLTSEMQESLIYGTIVNL